MAQPKSSKLDNTTLAYTSSRLSASQLVLRKKEVERSIQGPQPSNVRIQCVTTGNTENNPLSVQEDANLMFVEVTLEVPNHGTNKREYQVDLKPARAYCPHPVDLDTTLSLANTPVSSSTEGCNAGTTLPRVVNSTRNRPAKKMWTQRYQRPLTRSLLAVSETSSCP